MFKIEHEKLEHELKEIVSQLTPLVEKQKIAELAPAEKKRLSILVKQHESVYLKLQDIYEQESVFEASLVDISLNPQQTTNSRYKETCKM